MKSDPISPDRFRRKGAMSSVAAFLFFVVSLTAHAGQMEVPVEYWKSPVTADEVEAKDKSWSEEILALYSAATYVDGTGKEVAVDAKMRAEFAASVRRGVIRNNPDWIKIKQLSRSGDRIYEFMWPPLSGPTGCVLTRDGRAIHAVFVGHQ